MYRIAIIPGDGIGKEVMESGEYLLDKLDLNFSFEYGKQVLNVITKMELHYLKKPLK